LLNALGGDSSGQRIMKIFHCDSCGSLVFFDNVKCVKCGHVLGFLPAASELGALEATGPKTWRPIALGLKNQVYRQCQNGEQHEVCNWMVAINDTNPFCESCRLNELIPNLSQAGNLERWHKLEMAKRRLIYTLMRLGLPMEGGPENRPALHFKFIADVPGQPPMLTGHLNGLITINIAEADDAERERRRVTFHEPYRTLLGHLRHEVAHYYWDRLIANSKWLARFRELFGNETANYNAALQRHHKLGPPADWQAKYVSAYATTHPWEDWAETGAHYFHIVDMVETAGSFGLALNPSHPAAKYMTADLKNIVGLEASFDEVLANWFPLTHALNSLNRGMGLLDVYPFVLSDAAIEKLRFIDQVFRGR
jgi:hypothetical protein